ncbi:Sulfotransferase family protein [Paucidesulfovibrio gracilis DSM 16080]|uniref:Sulfotransferase family protein n=1 Tax=Paucidesulfovibrio gracilis DSM 16080 TaxID=1121449 RepID=A0A1T4XE02_9BACT|nr:sulfotransferase [Paucidesulfovibrio gracilis]SKA87689.1 Sulfotransferase family protein [Paucidesulfovibrio gracilis DSM 16080]
MSRTNYFAVSLARRKWERLRWVLAQARRDLSNDISWQLGGKRHFAQTWQQTATAHTWVFIVGCNNSGTSLLNALFAKSGLVSTMREEGQYNTRALLRMPLRGHERVWTEVLDRLEADAAELPQRMPRLLHDWMRFFTRPLHPVLVEKTPPNMARMPALDQLLDCRFIALVRDGFAVCEGIRRKAGKDLERAARHWDASCRLLLQHQTQVKHLHIVRYEDLTGQPEQTLAKLADFLELPPQPLQAASREKFNVGRTVAGTGAENITDYNAPSLQRLSDQDRETILRHAGDMLHHFGYLPERKTDTDQP